MSSLPLTLENRPPTVAHLFFDRVRATPDTVAYRFPGSGGEEWDDLTWAQAAERVRALAAGLMSLGTKPAERVAIASSTRIEWILADLANMCAGLATTTVYPTTNSDETAFILADSGSRVLFAEDCTQLGKVLAEQERLPDLRTVVVFDEPEEEAASDRLIVLTLAELEERGKEYLADQPDAVEKRVAELDADQLATLIYTSGTTGRPKGVRLVHDCWSYQAAAPVITGMLRPDDIQYLWLPLSHVFGKTLICGQIATGHVMAVDGRVDRIAENLATIRPTVLAAVPRIFEKLHNSIVAGARSQGARKERVFRWAAQIARSYARSRQAGARGGSVALILRAQHALADRLVYRSVRAVFGGRLRVAVSGSAALAPDIGYFFIGAGVPIVEGYGLTETAAGSTVNRDHAIRIGTVGTPYPGTETRIAEDGEVLLRGPSVMRGYHQLPDQTAEVLEPDGWFHTGDIGALDADGYLRITDRKKDLLKTSGGKYIAPSEIEGRLKALCPFVSTAVVIGDQRNYCTALIALDASALMPWAVERGIAGEYAAVVAAPETRNLVDSHIVTLNEGLQRWQTIKKFTLLPRDLDVEHGELTPSLKVKRAVVAHSYAEQISAMYDDREESRT
ncbi:AMP-dependent synthetase/ligase [Streptomyces fractus]|uniref:AMP-dependent synthetase/ligase n=1 Tax=Streptomyces fractus TaxID=641806 RepID=UPI003CF8AC21